MATLYGWHGWQYIISRINRFTLAHVLARTCLQLYMTAVKTALDGCEPKQPLTFPAPLSTSSLPLRLASPPPSLALAASAYRAASVGPRRKTVAASTDPRLTAAERGN
jgi:hypothetical protein